MFPTMSMSYKLQHSKRGLLCKILLPSTMWGKSNYPQPSNTWSKTMQYYWSGLWLKRSQVPFPHCYTNHCSQYQAVSLWFWFSPRYNSDAQLRIQPHFMRPKITLLASKTPNPIAHTYDVTKRFLVRKPEAHKHWQHCCFCNPRWQKDCC